MEDITNALLDVVRAQHSATEGTDEAPFNMDDIVDMAMNLLGRPDDDQEMKDMVSNIQSTVESLAPDIFPPKTFEQMDDSEKAMSAASMIENAFMRNNSSNRSSVESSPVEETPVQNDSYASANQYSYEEEEEESQNVGDLNDLIYKNFMEMMGLSTPQVEFPFDRSQIRYGKEKSVTEMLAEEEEEKARQQREESERNRKLSAWELAQNAIDTDEAAHTKESYVPQPVEKPAGKSASQMAAEAIRKSEEEDRMKLEIEKQAEAMMAEAKRRGQDPMKFMLHQQEILQYMEKNSDELVSFEDYEDLSPEEKLEIERNIHIEKQLADGVRPEDLDENVPEEYIPMELKPQAAVQTAQPAQAAMDEESGEQTSTFDEDTLRALSQQVMSENAEMFQGENSEEMAAFQEELFANLMRAMSGAGTPVPMEDVGDLLAQATQNSLGNDSADAAPSPSIETAVPPMESAAPQPEVEVKRGMSAVEIAMAAQRAAKPEPVEERQTLSAADIAREAQESARQRIQEEEALAAKENPVEEKEELDMNFDELDDLFDEGGEDEAAEEVAVESEEKAVVAEETVKTEQKDIAVEETAEDKEDSEDDEAEEMADSLDDLLEEKEEDSVASKAAEEDDEYEYVDPDELVLGEHTQAEIDEAMENLNSLGLEGEVFERAKRMLLLELAGSEAALDAWLFEQENSKKKKKAAVSALDEEDLDDLSDFDEDLFEKELEMAIEEDFDEEDSNDGEDSSEEETIEEIDELMDEVEEDGEESDEQDDVSEESSSEPGEDIGGTDDDISVEEENIDESIEIDVIDDKEIEAEAVDATVETPVEEVPEIPEEKTEVKEKKKAHRNVKNRKSVVHKKDKSEKTTKEAKEEEKEQKEETPSKAEERGYEVSVRKPFVLKNSTSYIDKFADFITENQENRKLSTGFKKLDGMLRFGLHKGSYFIDAQPQYLKNSFMQQIADRSAESGVDVLYISTELSRYDLMVDTISRLSYEMNGHDSEKAHSVMAIMTGEDGATLESLEDELNWFRGRISEHLFILDQEAVDEYIDSMEDLSAGAILEELIRSIVREGAHKPVVFIDNIENILSVEDSEDMKPLMLAIKSLAKELSIPILMSYGYAQAESEEELSEEELEFHESLGNMCDVYLELQYADMITEDSVEITEEDIREMVEDGESLLIDVLIHRNRRPMRASCQIQGTPKYNFFEE